MARRSQVPEFVAAGVLAITALTWLGYMAIVVIWRGEKPDTALVALMGAVIGAAGTVLRLGRRRNGNGGGPDALPPGPS